MNISVYKPSIRRKEMDAVLTCMVSDRIGFGEAASQLVKDLSAYIGCKGGFAYKEYYRAISTALEALGLEPGSGIIVSALAPELYEMVIRDCGFTPVILDVDPDTGCLSAELAEQNAESAAAIIMHYTMGFVPDAERLLGIGLPVIEDISMALGAEIGEAKAGSLGRFTILNMDEDGMITSGGGAVVLSGSNKDRAALKAAAEKLHPSMFLPDMNASLAIAQLNNISDYLDARAEIADIFVKSVMRSKHKILMQKSEDKNVYYSFPVILETGLAEVAAYARKKNILTEPAFAGAIAAYSDEAQGSCPEAKALLLRCVNFPLYPMLGKKNIAEISKVLSSLP